ncbi:MAG: CHRD domain-containing protein [Phycisphaerae bacterium]
MKLPIVLVTALASMAVALPVQAEILEFNIPLTVSQEPHEVSLPGYPEGVEPSGVGFITYDTDTNDLSWTIYFAGLTGDLAAAHFHGPAAIGEPAGAIVPIPTAGGVSGVLAGTDTDTVTDAMETDLLAGLWYVNLHTAENGAGEIRGQLLGEPIPEPTVIALLGIGGMFALRRRKRIA